MMSGTAPALPEVDAAELARNLASHAVDTDRRCTSCGAKYGGPTFLWPCGTRPPRVDLDADPSLDYFRRSGDLYDMAEDYVAEVARVKAGRAGAVAELDQSEAALGSLDRFLDALRPWADDPTRDGWPLGRILADVARLDPEAHARLIVLHDAAFPTGFVEVPR